MTEFDLRAVRASAGLSQAELAARVGVSQKTVSQWETGERPILPARMLRIAEVLDESAPEAPSVPSVISYRDERRREALAGNMVPVAAELACMVREEDREAIGAFVARLAPGGLPEDVVALLVVLAAMVPVERPVGDLLAWIDWDEHGQAVA